MFHCARDRSGVATGSKQALRRGIRRLAARSRSGGTVRFTYGAADRGGRGGVDLGSGQGCVPGVVTVLAPPRFTECRQGVDRIEVRVRPVQSVAVRTLQNGAVILVPVGDPEVLIVANDLMNHRFPTKGTSQTTRGVAKPGR